jgi:ferredoxin-type protein NapH
MKLSLSDINRATQVFGLFLCNAYTLVLSRKVIYKGSMKAVCLPFIYCHACPTANFACPMGTMQYYATVHKFPFFLVGHLFLLGLLVGRMACGWLCPFGLLQDLINKIPSKKYDIPHWLSYGKYLALLALVVVIPYLVAENWFSKLCPLGTLVAGIPWVLWNPIGPNGQPTIAAGAVGALFAVKVLILAGFLVSFVFIKRPFCRIACPMGAFYAPFNRYSFMRLEVDPSCNRCDACVDVCPVDMKVYEDPNSPECVRCLRCVQCKQVSVTVPISRLLRHQGLGAFQPAGPAPVGSVPPPRPDHRRPAGPNEQVARDGGANEAG